MDDFQLAIAIARVVEGSNEGPVLTEILSGTVIPAAFEAGNRYLGSWAFWVLHRRDLAVRILLVSPTTPQKLDSRIMYWRTSQAPLQDIASVFNVMVEEIKEPHYDDPTLALLFSQLRMKTLQAAKGTSEISGRSEFKFILQIAKVFCRMGGCLSLASQGVGAQVKLPFRMPCSCTRPCPILVIRPAVDCCPFAASLTPKRCHQLYLSSTTFPT
jgi:hypothetical protein